jgi:hypothetical protein
LLYSYVFRVAYFKETKEGRKEERNEKDAKEMNTSKSKGNKLAVFCPYIVSSMLTCEPVDGFPRNVA